MLHLLKRHPFGVEATLQRSLVLTYAVPEKQLAPLLGPGLELDTFGGWGFVAIAMVMTQHLRPLGMPRWFGSHFFLCGYRIFARFTAPGKRPLRGLRILRSDTDRRHMVVLGNLFTHYRYEKAALTQTWSEASWELRIETPRASADLHVVANLAACPAPLPDTSPFTTMEDAQRFAGPLPYTFDYERETKRMILIKGVRKTWSPVSVAVTVRRATFMDQPCFEGARLANAFVVRDVPYVWKPGQVRAFV